MIEWRKLKKKRKYKNLLEYLSKNRDYSTVFIFGPETLKKLKDKTRRCEKQLIVYWNGNSSNKIKERCIACMWYAW